MPPLALLAFQTLQRTGALGPRPARALAQLALGLGRTGPSLYSLLAWHAARTPHAPALADARESLTARQLLARADHFAALLAAHPCGGGAVALLTRTPSADAVGALLACGRLGRDVLLLNATHTPAESLRLCREARAELLLLDRASLQGIEEAECKDVHPLPLDVLRHMPHQRPLRLPRPRRVGQWRLLTSGTTGRPKPVQRPPANPDALRPLLAALERLPLDNRTPVLLPLPLFHGHGLSTLALALALGAPLRLTSPQPAALWQALQDLRGGPAGVLSTVPTLLHRLLPELEEGTPPPNLRAIICGSGVLEAPLCRRVLRAFGPVLYNLYGTTETGLLCLATPADLQAAAGTVGRPLAGVSLKLGAGGEVVQQRGGQVVATGDLGAWDAAGRLHLQGRADDLLTRGGETFHPAQVEACLLEAEGVAECAVYGVSGGEYGLRLTALLVPHAGASLEVPALQAHAAALLPRTLRPDEWRVVEALPRNAVGKLLRRKLVGWV